MVWWVDVSAVFYMCENMLVTDVDVRRWWWDRSVLKRVDKVKFAGCSTRRDKQLHMVGYLLELGYDLLLAQQDNVSQSPGFETCLGVFG